MPPIRFGTHDLLQHDPRYGILICRECQYAIQKSALKSHLLRHKIYREERQSLLSSLSKLELFEPDDVPLPAPSTPPINALPLLDGFRCLAPECGNLCASSKRMRRHWSESHGLSEASDLATLARSAKIQTFFRGTKIRYFEVTLPTTQSSTVASPARIQKSPTPDINQHDITDENSERQTKQSSPPRLFQDDQVADSRGSVDQVNLDTLTYFHHFLTKTSLALPRGSTTHFWQTDIVSQALCCRWLMCGLMAVAAYHLAILSEDRDVEEMHRERAFLYLADFRNSRDRALERDVEPAGAAMQDQLSQASERISCLIQCIHWTANALPHNQNIRPRFATMSPLEFAMTAIQCLSRSNLVNDLDNTRTYNPDDRGYSFAQANRIVQSVAPPDASESPEESTQYTRSSLLSRLDTLPTRMANIYSPPRFKFDVHEVFVTLESIAALIQCCEVSFASDDLETTWSGMAMWLTKIPESFRTMVGQGIQIALVVLAHWALLVKRAENCGCWYLSGWVEKIVHEVQKSLQAESEAVQGLVADLLC
ncbi:hypothetical protein BU24DRAFT_418069 [Aaosphaeria arxii CBS 175.79]|uniref:C2H2-type domain-containing protein n=1 Tax=Aaosphaeria arxii CBS 175.79 TaxID=1450172 RepID=A0A6A5XZ00_9PLEO|nr:uncharacterized protein BU24DRAFT_418069 [Aaosphaeria arxii CBS 175.79]KAF2018545.1 hypothetical protein BU24DRAFT_418069 [Aaosphaeria arxii CBS 175.79]